MSWMNSVYLVSMKVSFNTCDYRSVMDSPNATSSCFSFMGSYGISPSFPNIHSILTFATTTSSMLTYILITHNFLIYGLDLASNLWRCLYPEFVFFEKVYPTFHSIFALFLLVLVWWHLVWFECHQHLYWCIFWTIQVYNFAKSIGARFNFLNHSLALPLRFNFVILNNY